MCIQIHKWDFKVKQVHCRVGVNEYGFFSAETDY